MRNSSQEILSCAESMDSLKAIDCGKRQKLPSSGRRTAGVEFLYHPAAQQGGFAHAFGFGNLLDRFGLMRTQVNRNRGTRRALKDRIADFFQLVLELRQVMAVPESSEFLNRISRRDLMSFHCFFHRLNCRFSFSVIARAVTGKPFPLGNWITTQNRCRPDSVCPRT